MPRPHEYDYKIDLDKPLILSVPSTGTHTLKKITGIKRHWHFGVHDDDIATFRGRAHIPIRDPFEASLTWQGKHSEYTEEGIGLELSQWDRLIEYVEGNHHRSTLHKIEDYELREFARSDCPEKHDLDLALTLPRIKRLQSWIKEGGRLEFFKQFYEDFWWLTK